MMQPLKSFLRIPPALSPGQEHSDAAARLRNSNAKSFLYRAAQLRGLALLGLLCLVLAILGAMIWRNLERFETVRSYVSYSHRVQQVGLDLQQGLTDYLSGRGELDYSKLSEVYRQVNDLMQVDYHLAPDTPARLRQVDALIATAQSDAESSDDRKNRLLAALSTMSALLDAETTQRERVLETISQDTRIELELASGTLAAILLLAGLFIKRRILAPLHDLKELLLRLAKEDFRPISTEHLDPLLLPVFTSYNEMVRHLGELEEAKRVHAESLEAEVRAATQALLEQQSSLARAERLAAVGELAAGIAHELRNPLAGIRMSCNNLRSEIGDPDQVERLNLISAELKRMTHLLNGLLAQGRHTPTPTTRFNLARLVRELVTLTRYQIPPQIGLAYHVPQDLECRLPECDLRQALLNLLLNAAQALDGRPGNVVITAQRDRNMLIVSVADDGPGFSDEMLSGGIRPFSTGRNGGTGLGLAIVHRFAHEAGGQIKLCNRQPHGAEASLRVPCDER